MSTKKTVRGPATAVPCPWCGVKNDFTGLGVSADKGMVVSCEVIDKVTGAKKGGCGKVMQVIRVQSIPVVWVAQHRKKTPTEFAAQSASCASHMCTDMALEKMNCGACAGEEGFFVVHYCAKHHHDAMQSMSAHIARDHQPTPGE